MVGGWQPSLCSELPPAECLPACSARTRQRHLATTYPLQVSFVGWLLRMGRTPLHATASERRDRLHTWPEGLRLLANHGLDPYDSHLPMSTEALPSAFHRPGPRGHHARRPRCLDPLLRPR